MQKGIKRNPEYIERFFRNLLMGEKNELKNRSMHIENEVQSITPEASKSQIDTLNCTLEEKALLDCIRLNPHIKQQEVADQIGKSIATIKRLTAGLIAKGIIERKNGKRNGFWEVKV